ncbi:MAG: response regulator [Verrucomicrobiota bacterium]|jgi:two-component system NtrC family sensor kinase
MSASRLFLNRRVLTVDDNPTIHEDFRKILSKEAATDGRLEDLESNFFEARSQPDAHDGFEVDSASQGEEGLAKVLLAVEQHRPYAVAFVDMRMPPGWDGVETIARLWSADPALQVVICTAYSDHSWREILTQLGNRDNLAVLKKPFDNIEVIQLCETLSRKWSLARALHDPERTPPHAQKTAT